MAKKLNSMRFLDSKGVSYDVFNFPDTIHAAQDVAAHIGVATSEVYKTLVLMTAKQTPTDLGYGAGRPSGHVATPPYRRHCQR